ncbi:ArsR family transcriptional regulator [Mycobacterium hubeiense]|uniref:arsenate reductase/protein-tyrosine-phosphatase family protein n=1 Tax=Mycobacterium hubeiense TaxID=1867256 RepID=UPI000C7F707D|nr:helix-turn-helix domain-containing protein [Mycobacterium sp. QGD 101]
MDIENSPDTLRRASVHAALADPGRLALVDLLMSADASPSELQASLSMPSNLLAHHVKVLEDVGLVQRVRSEGDRRRTYLKLVHGPLEALVPRRVETVERVVFVCTQNSARSQLATAVWHRRCRVPATSAGTHPASRVHPEAVAAARRRGIPMRPRRPQHLSDVLMPTDLVIAVCDNAHEELPADVRRLHWSIADPVRTALPGAFDQALDDLTDRVERFAPTVRSA